jgi:hypothetical protein
MPERFMDVSIDPFDTWVNAPSDRSTDDADQDPRHTVGEDGARLWTMDPLRIVRSIHELYRWECTACGEASRRWFLTKAEAINAGDTHLNDVHRLPSDDVGLSDAG